MTVATALAQAPAPAVWSSDHVFIAPGRMSDLFLVRVAAPVLREMPGVRRWFFIRYGEGGPHLRIRVDADDEALAETIRRHWREAAPQYLDGAALGPEWQAHGEPLFERGSVQPIAYQPEIERYGGPRVMAANEHLFCRSTLLALGIISATLDDFERRLGQAVKIMIASAAALTDDPRAIAEIFSNYAAGWERFLTPFGWTPDRRPVELRDPVSIEASLLETTSGLRSYSSVWHASLLGLIAELDAEDNRPLTSSKTNIVMSQLHMFCNRLGLSPSMEFHFASQLANAL